MFGKRDLSGFDAGITHFLRDYRAGKRQIRAGSSLLGASLSAL